MDKLLKIDEVSELARVPVNTLRWMRQRGEGPPAGKIGRRIFYREADVIAWVNAQFDREARQRA